MNRPIVGHLRTLERMEKTLEEALAQMAEVPSPRQSAEGRPLPSGLLRAGEAISAIEEALARATVHAAGIENLLQTEADTFAAWLEKLVQVTGQLKTWAGVGKSAS